MENILLPFLLLGTTWLGEKDRGKGWQEEGTGCSSPSLLLVEEGLAHIPSKVRPLEACFLMLKKRDIPLAPLLLEDYPRDEEFPLGESYGSLDKDFPLKTKKCRADMMRLSKQGWDQGSSKEKQGQASGLSPGARNVPKSS